VAAIIIDAADGLMDGDKRVAGYTREAGRAAVIVVNKWDLCGSGPAAKSRREFTSELRKEMPFLNYAPIVFASAKQGRGVTETVDAAVAATENFAMRIGTGELNRMIHEIVDAKPLTERAKQFKVYYSTMTSVKPPTIILFTNDPTLLHFSYARYLDNQIRKRYPYEGTPIRIIAKRAESERSAQ
jgi:GTP-binding protein